ncbi:MAG TPA: peptidoglycan recognition family protein [Anaerohalosphaeraceae bacterium]|jgi:hypothetical protein|nr:peptidoglycan recognition family protein [Anaerohalosphaeraceae bacterium]HRT51109.1 peptidoglycan recognition family protein [Anaerohalosphaeraceae bacterium]HRT87124.1 peptidoglycan recognition family protein [Anaerohalosphaeraceae bacterium]
MAKDAVRVLALGALVALCGCSSQQIQPPQITGKVMSVPPRPVVTASPATNVNWNAPSYPAGWIPRAKERQWTAIVIHHSATDRGSMAAFDDYHRQEHNWDGIGYDFVIGNGKGSGDGQVEVTYRWREQLVGAHCKTPDNWANERGIGICLVGDFTKTKPTWNQMKSLKELVRFLQQRYGIPKSRVYGHCEVPGYTQGSVCPGRYFPMSTFRASLL